MLINLIVYFLIKINCMNTCDNRISLRKIDGISIWTIKWVINWETTWKDFPDVVSQIKDVLGCGSHHGCRNKNECSISRLHKDWTRWTLALI